MLCLKKHRLTLIFVANEGILATGSQPSRSGLSFYKMGPQLLLFAISMPLSIAPKGPWANRNGLRESP